MRLEFLHIAARVIHLQQGAVVRLRPRLARIGRRRALSPAGCVLQHAVQRADDLRPVADAVGRQTLPRQRIDAVRQLGQQRLARSSSIPLLLSPPRSTAVKYPAPHKAPQASDSR